MQRLWGMPGADVGLAGFDSGMSATGGVPFRERSKEDAERQETEESRKSAEERRTEKSREAAPTFRLAEFYNESGIDPENGRLQRY